jgi:hypothetical protein
MKVQGAIKRWKCGAPRRWNSKNQNADGGWVVRGRVFARVAHQRRRCLFVDGRSGHWAGYVSVTIIVYSLTQFSRYRRILVREAGESVELTRPRAPRWAGETPDQQDNSPEDSSEHEKRSTD